ncbi:MAG: GtrA family protein [Hydrogenophilus sp.]|nr:GtrA family protein [Hydrogenophilus sp.]
MSAPRPPFLLRFLRPLLAFATASLAGTAVHYSLLILLVESHLLTPTPATALGYLAGALTNYHFARRWAFRSSQKPHRRALPQFLVVAASGWFLNTTLIYLLTASPFAFPYLPAQVGVTILLFLWHYTANRFWTFSR